MIPTLVAEESIRHLYVVSKRSWGEILVISGAAGNEQSRECAVGRACCQPLSPPSRGEVSDARGSLIDNFLFQGSRLAITANPLF